MSEGPKRIQLRRTKGWRKPENAVNVARPTKWGNPFAVGEDVPDFARSYLVSPMDPNRAAVLRSLYSLNTVRILSAAQAAQAYGWWIIEQPSLMLALPELTGHDLACWCKPSDPCHADLLLELANPPAVSGEGEQQ